MPELHPDFNKNDDTNKLAVGQVNRLLDKIAEGGGLKRQEKLRAEGKMTARERIQYLLDEGAPVLEEVTAEVDHIGLFDGEHRSFAGILVNRRWALQRIGQGPWRIATREGI